MIVTNFTTEFLELSFLRVYNNCELYLASINILFIRIFSIFYYDFAYVILICFFIVCSYINIISYSLRNSVVPTTGVFTVSPKVVKISTHTVCKLWKKIALLLDLLPCDPYPVTINTWSTIVKSSA